MVEQEFIVEYFNRMQLFVNEMKACAETISIDKIVEKNLRTLPPWFDHFDVTIEETKDFDSLKADELHNSLKAHEQRRIERVGTREIE